jgi:UPF0042 nucleotide-binding protein
MNPSRDASPEAPPRDAVILISGISGSGKTVALSALEDAGYFCVDNLPPELLREFIWLERQFTRRVAVAVDIRTANSLPLVRPLLEQLRAEGVPIHSLFFDAGTETLVRRFSETRRRHPLAGDDLREGIARERDILKSLREEASAYVDTGHLNVHQLKGVIHERYRRSADVLAVTLLSFGFKHGLPAEADMVLDVRFLPNPYFVEALSAATGEEQAVRDFVLDNADAREFLEKTEMLLEFVLPRAEREGKAYLTVAIGCTGGRHRSVAVVQELAKRLPGRNPLTVRHRDLARGRE